MLTMHEIRRKGSASRPTPPIRVWRKNSVDSRQALKSACDAVQAAQEAAALGDTQAKLSDALRRAERAEQRVAELESDVIGYQADAGRDLKEIQDLDNSLRQCQRLLSTSEAESKVLSQELRMALLNVTRLEAELAEARSTLAEAIEELNARPVVRIKAGWDRVRELEVELEASKLRHEVEVQRAVNEALKSVALKR